MLLGAIYRVENDLSARRHLELRAGLQAAHSALLAPEEANTNYRKNVILPLKALIPKITLKKTQEARLELARAVSKLSKLLNPNGTAPSIKLDIGGMKFIDLLNPSRLEALPVISGAKRVVVTLDLRDPDQIAELLRFVAAIKCQVQEPDLLILRPPTLADIDSLVNGVETLIPPALRDALVHFLGSEVEIYPGWRKPDTIRSFIETN